MGFKLNSKFKLVMNLTSLFVMVYYGCKILNTNTDYYLIGILPFVFILFIGLISKFSFNNTPITLYSFVLLEWIRFVVMPFFILLENNKGLDYMRPELFTISNSILFMVYEMIFVIIFLYFIITYINSKYKVINYAPVNLGGSKIIYVLFLIIALLCFLFYPQSSELINFIYIKSSATGERVGDITNSFDLLIRQVFIIALSIIFFFSLNVRNRFYLSLFVGVLLVSIIIGERRSAQIYSAFSVIILLISVYKNKTKTIIISILIPAFLIILIMSVYKFFNVFLYDDYASAINESSSLKLSQLLEMYFFGPQNLAKSFDFSYIEQTSFLHLIYDFFRSVFGLSQIIKNELTLTSALFNQYVYGELTVKTGQVLSASGYGAVFFGIGLAPIFVIINLILSLFSEILMKITRTLEFRYVFSILTIRFATNLFGPTPALISYATMTLFTMGSVYLVSIALRKYI